MKTSLTASTNEPPTETAKVAFVSTQGDGQLRFGSFKDSTLVGDFVRLQNVGDRHVASITCATHDDRAGTEGGALLVASSCPAATFDVEFILQSRARLDGSLTFGGNDADAGAPDAEKLVLVGRGRARLDNTRERFRSLRRYGVQFRRDGPDAQCGRGPRRFVSRQQRRQCRSCVVVDQRTAAGT